MKKRAVVALVVSLFMAGACSSSDTKSTTETTPPSTGSTTSIPNSEVLLADLSKSMNLQVGLPLDSCEIEDITPNGLSGHETNTSGFLIPDQAVDQVGEVWLRIVPTESSDGQIEPNRIENLQSTLRAVSDFFHEQSFGQARLKWFVEEKSAWLRLPESNEELGIVGASHTEDKSDLMERILGILRPPSSPRDKQLALVLLPSEPTSQIEQTTRSVDGKPVNGIHLENGIILSSNLVMNWKSLAHSLGHSWLRAEDLYHHEFFGAPQDYFGMWDIMAFASAPVPEFSGWFRWRSGWLKDEEIRCDDMASSVERFISPIDSESGSVKLTVIPMSNHSALLIEVRTRPKLGENGLVALVYAIDTSFEHGNGPFRLVGTLEADGDFVDSASQRIARVESDPSGVIVEFEVL